MSYPDEEYRAAMIADGQDWQTLLQKSDKGTIKPTLHNACLLLKWSCDAHQWLVYDEFREEPAVVGETPWRRYGRQWIDGDALEARHRIGSIYGVDMPTPMMHDAADLVAKQTRVHPVRDYLNRLQWDGTARINEWLMRYLGAVTNHGGDCRQYLGCIGSMWLIGAVARVMQPGVKFDYLLIFEGGQGAGKSTTLQILGGDWTLDTPIVIGDKDAYQALRGKWIVELAELDSFNKAESTKAKAFFSSGTDSYRASYGRKVQDVPRQCVFAGTTNEEAYLRDGTGNRRYWPFLARRAQLAELERDRDQLWAEAVVQWREGIPFWPQEHHREIFEAQQALREIEDPWESVIGLYLDDAAVRATLRERGLSTHEVLRDAIKVDAAKMDERAMQMRVAKCLRRLGLVRRQSATRDARLGSRYVYVRPTSENEPEGGSQNEF